MLQAILRQLSTSDLIKCRQVNGKFNEIASQTLRQRDDINLHFSGQDQDRKYMQKMNCDELLVNICKAYSAYSSKSLADLVSCLKKSNQFPVTSFRFDEFYYSKFGIEDMRSFLSIWGTNILSLNIDLNDQESSNGLLRDVLIDKVPNLKKLEIRFSWNKFPSSIELFAESNEFELPKLQVLVVHKNYRQFRGIIGNILKAACNLNDFVCVVEDKYQFQSTCVKDGITPEDLIMLESYNKLHCLKKLRIDLSEELITFWQKSTKTGDVKLDSLALSLELSVLKNEKLKSAATAIINRLLQSSKDTMETLAIEPLGSLPQILIPKMCKLKKLDLWGSRRRETTMNVMFPPLFEMADNFPCLKELCKKISILFL